MSGGEVTWGSIWSKDPTWNIHYPEHAHDSSFSCSTLHQAKTALGLKHCWEIVHSFTFHVPKCLAILYNTYASLCCKGKKWETRPTAFISMQISRTTYSSRWRTTVMDIFKGLTKKVPTHGGKGRLSIHRRSTKHTGSRMPTSLITALYDIL